MSGCGFQLRSYDFEGSVESYALIGKTNSRVADALQRTLSQLDVARVEPETATLVVTFLDQRNERRSVSTAGQARAAEYEVNYAVRYRIDDNQGNELAPPIWVERERVYRIDRDNIVGSSEEQALLERELVQELAGQIVRAMNAVSRGLNEVTTPLSSDAG